jgi:hypothetical protein
LPDTGQHINFPTKLSLEKLASSIGWNLTSSGTNIHLLSKSKPKMFQILAIKYQKVAWIVGYLLYPFLRSRSLSKEDLKSASENIYGSSTEAQETKKVSEL